jgi:hypothetical protein
MYVAVPPWMKAKYGGHLKNFQLNARSRLVTPYDVHATLDHILLGFDGHYFRKGLGYSLFYPIPRERTCADAGVPANHCGCLSRKRLSLSDGWFGLISGNGFLFYSIILFLLILLLYHLLLYIFIYILLDSV